MADTPVWLPADGCPSDSKAVKDLAKKLTKIEVLINNAKLVGGDLSKAELLTITNEVKENTRLIQELTDVMDQRTKMNGEAINTVDASIAEALKHVQAKFADYDDYVSGNSATSPNMRLNVLADIVNDIQLRLGDSLTEISKHEKLINDLTDRHTDHVNQLNAFRDDVTNLNNLISNIKPSGSIAPLDKVELDKIRREIVSLSNVVLADIGSLKQVDTTFGSKLDLIELNIASIKTIADKNKIDVETLAQKLNHHIIQISDMNKLVADLGKEFSEKLQKFAQATANNFKAVHEQLTTSNQELYAQIRDVDKKLDVSNKDIAESVNQMSIDLTNIINTMGHKIEDCENNMATIPMLENSVNKLDAMISNSLRGIVPNVQNNIQKTTQLMADVQLIQDTLANLKVNGVIGSNDELNNINNQIKALAEKIFSEVDHFKQVDLDTTAKIDALKIDLLDKIAKLNVSTIGMDKLNDLETKLRAEIIKNKIETVVTNIHVVLSQFPKGVNPTSNKTEFTVDATKGKYVGFCASADQSPPNQAGLYRWVKIGGEKGDTGDSYYTHIRFAETKDGYDHYNNKTTFTTDPEKSFYIGIQQNSKSETPSDNHTDYVWANHFPKGTQFTHIVYSKYPNGKNALGALDTKYDDGDTLYMGTAITASPHASINPDEFTWNRITGKIATTVDKLYHHFVYSKYEKGKDSKGTSSFSITPQKGFKYLGIRTNHIDANPPKNADMYIWISLGIKGTKGDAGKTLYTHIRFSNDKFGYKIENGKKVPDLNYDPDGMKYIGFAVNVEDELKAPTDPTKYLWWEQAKGTKGDKGDKGDKTVVHFVYSDYPDGIEPINNTVTFSDKTGKNTRYMGIRNVSENDMLNLTDPTVYTWTRIKGDVGASLKTYYGFSDFRDGVDGQNRFAISDTYNGQRYMLISANNTSTDRPMRPDSYSIKIDLGQLAGKGKGFTKAEVESICADISANHMGQVERKINHSWIAYGNLGDQVLESKPDGQPFAFVGLNKTDSTQSFKLEDYEFVVNINDGLNKIDLSRNRPTFYAPLVSSLQVLVGKGIKDANLLDHTQFVEYSRDSKAITAMCSGHLDYLAEDVPDITNLGIVLHSGFNNVLNLPLTKLDDTTLINYVGCTKTINKDIAPDGSKASLIFKETTENSAHQIIITPDLTLEQGKEFNISFYVKAKFDKVKYIRVSETSGVTNDSSLFKLSKNYNIGFDDDSSVDENRILIEVCAGYYNRLCSQFTCHKTGKPRIVFELLDENKQEVYQGDTSGDMAIWGLQITKSCSVMPYIKQEDTVSKTELSIPYGGNMPVDRTNFAISLDLISPVMVDGKHQIIFECVNSKGESSGAFNLSRRGSDLVFTFNDHDNKEDFSIVASDISYRRTNVVMTYDHITSKTNLYIDGIFVGSKSGHGLKSINYDKINVGKFDKDCISAMLVSDLAIYHRIKH